MQLKRPRAAWMTSLLTTTTAGLLILGTVPAGAVAGDPVADGGYSFSAKLDIGEGKRSCSAALINPTWLITAASCFAADPANPSTVTAGRPADKTVATVGRADLGGTAGKSVEVVDLKPRADRDLVLARLASPVFGVTPVALATAAPAVGDTLRATGYGRTGDEWVPTRLHSAAVTVKSAAATTVTIAPKAPATGAICKGDTGGPTFKENGTTAVLAGVHSLSWQGGCFGSTETRTDAVETRVDDIRQWIADSSSTDQALLAPDTKLASGQTLAGRDLQLTMGSDGNLTITHKGIPNGVIWATGTGGNPGAYAWLQPDGNFVVYTADNRPIWNTATWTSGGNYLSLQDDGNLVVYKKDGGPLAGNAVWGSGSTRIGNTITSGQPVWSAQWAEARSTVLIMQRDGNLAVYRKSDGAYLWGTGTYTSTSGYFVMQSDGNAVVYPAGQGNGVGSVWNSATWWSAGAFMKLQDDGNLVIYKKEGGEGVGGAIWSTNTFA
ncbi:trypsin-like serine protease [Kitasatospora sp. NPDC091207]|uniref:trypsin-like serine protease n=1 Tax=Kitasatospora sp. NPDC091207 TaxID=3364083 RepID=UPI00381D2087